MDNQVGVLPTVTLYLTAIGKFFKESLIRLLTILITALLIILSGCIGMTGGPCEYTPHLGTAQVISINKEDISLQFHLSPNNTLSNKTLENKLNGYQFDISRNKLANPHIGYQYHAVVSVITKGACGPIRFKVENSTGTHKSDY
ncbi:MAG: hypothetical protein R8K22_04955 [Mariprofundaceae bacterium]